MNNKINKLALAISMALAGSVQAEETPSTGDNAAQAPVIEEMVVTAQKREQNLQDTPIAISAFGAEELEQLGVNDVSDLSATTPNVQIAPSPGGSTGATIAIRGASMINPAITWEPAVGLYFDGVFVAKNAGGLFDVANIERIEVLRGPQGTLYGKNTTGGAINIITRKPSEENTGFVSIGRGNYDLAELDMSVDSGQVGIARFNVAYNNRSRDGFDKNYSVSSPIDEFKQLESEAARFSGVFDVSDTVGVEYSYDRADRDNTVAMAQPEFPLPSLELPRPERRNEGALDGAGKEQSTNSGHALHVSWDINDTTELKSISSYRKMRFNDQGDYDGMDAVAFHTERDVDQEQRSQEFQLIGSNGSLDYLLGVYYFDDQADARNPYNVGIIIDNFYGVDSVSRAVYGQADYRATDALTLTLGGRFTRETKESYVNHPRPFMPSTEFYAEARKTWSNFSPMFSASVALNDNLTTYFKVSDGWKAGGFNGEAGTYTDAVRPYSDEEQRAYEIGVKSILADRLQANAAIFYNQIEDLQISSWDPSINASVVGNAGEARTSGFELEMQFAATSSMNLYANYGFLDTEYKEYIDPVTLIDMKEVSEFPYAPENTYSIGGDYQVTTPAGDLSLRVDYAYVDSQYFYPDMYSAMVTASEDYSLLNARLTLNNIPGNDYLEVAIWGKNLQNSEYRLNGIPAASGAGLNYYGDPKTWGIELTHRF